MKIYFFLTYFFLQTTLLLAQHQELTEVPDLYKKNKSTDTKSFLHAFKSGTVNGHFRYFFMCTDNQNKLTDYYANAAGGGLRFETAKFYGFQMAVSGFYTFNLGSSDFSKVDSATKQSNRYESALFDIEQPGNKDDLSRLEEFYVKYNFKKSKIVLGRQLINTPFINLQDGRMRPTGVSGVWFNINEIKNTGIEGGWIKAISPRGTLKWFNSGASIGVYSSGVNIDGSKSDYENNLKSDGVALIGIHHQITNELKFQFWDMFTSNIFNTEMVQLDWEHRLKDSTIFFAAVQGIHQEAINDGGNADPSKTYFNKGQQSFAFGGKIGWKNKILEASINYNRITSDGRYLVPREWGRDPFFTFMPRERNEGLGNVNAYVAKLNYNIPKSNVKTSISFGYFHLPDVKNYKLNKYGMPSYAQFNADVRYVFSGLLKGFDSQLLLVGKIKKGNSYENDKYVINKVNLIQYNVVLNYHF